MPKRWMVLIATFIGTLAMIQLSPIYTYIASLKQDSAVQAVSVFMSTSTSSPVSETEQTSDNQAIIPGNDEQLRQLIREEAAKQQVAAIDAKVDPVWKAIPGYNGLEVDEQATYRLAKSGKPGDPLRLVTTEIAPKVGLADLGSYPIYKGNPHKPMVALMINVAWGEEFLPKMLKIMDDENVHATFFFDGSWLSQHVETAKEIMRHGHEMSNHGYSHRNMSKLSRTLAVEEITKTQNLLEQQLGVHNVLFAPPSGDFDQETVDIAHQMKMHTILWTLDTLDWKNPPPSVIVRKVATYVEPGTLILMHPTSSSSAALSEIIKAIKGKGLSLGTVSDVISPSRVTASQFLLQF
ncbi:MAG: polysaccharide deacetylase [Paenibacillaceae bacterium]|nr:polysaccharide deacetylase [Paenibacillaceae bacterium]